VAPDSNSKVVLVVDDEMFARLFAVQIFLDLGFTVLEAGSAEEGLDILDRNDDVDLLFTDISMPGEMDGLALVRHVRAEHAHIALLVTSGHVEPSGGLLAEGALFLAKPYTAHALTQSIGAAALAIDAAGRRRPLVEEGQGPGGPMITVSLLAK
jgi:CheY-like chemotaxis protein